jgi:hypothetical protein
VHSDFSDLLSTFNAHRVDYLVVGAHALAAHGLIRATNDLDVFVRPSEQNAVKVFAALAEFGAPLSGLTREGLASPGLIFQIGVPPLRIDVINEIGISFDEAWSDRVEAKLGDTLVPVLSRRALLINKKEVGRTQDLANVEWLERHTP